MWSEVAAGAALVRLAVVGLVLGVLEDFVLAQDWQLQKEQATQSPSVLVAQVERQIAKAPESKVLIPFFLQLLLLAVGVAQHLVK